MKKNINVFAILTGDAPHSVVLPFTYQSDGSDLVIKDILARVEGALNNNVEADFEGVKYNEQNGILIAATIKVSVEGAEQTDELNIWLYHVGAEWQKSYLEWNQYWRFQKEF